MKLLITGMGGTLAPKLAAAARLAGHEIIAWDRSRADPSNQGACQTLLSEIGPDAIAHLAFGPESWAALLAGWAGEASIPFIFSSSVMVFGDKPNGPHHPQDKPTSQEDYGLYKARCEDAVMGANSQAMIVRLGWQIHPDAVGNNMLGQLDSWQTDKGRVDASRLWIPACSFMEDTADGLLSLLGAPRPGIHHLDGNAQDAWSFDRIVSALKSKFARHAWNIVVNEDYSHDQRLLGSPGLCRPLSQRLTAP